jgi:4-amino-4-deoxy-L-arabinose transferase-like glycosyltransferase
LNLPCGKRTTAYNAAAMDRKPAWKPDMLSERLRHHVLLILAAGLLYLPNLGAPSLWDIDEGNNVEAAREMRERGDLVVPQFNYQLRVDKPALLYWLQIAAFRVCGVNELGGRLPSALAAALTVLIAYELGRQVLTAAASLIAALVLASATLFTAAAHFANPDALLNLFSTLSLFLFWRGIAHGRRDWFVLAGVSSGLAVLAKGPVGLVLPSTVAFLFLLWSRRLRLLLDRRLIWGALAFAVVAVPWYAWVGAETRMEWLKGFFLVHNFGRFHAAMQGHHGPFYYYGIILILGLLPWSVFLGPALWSSVRLLFRSDAEPAPDNAPWTTDFHRYLWCWFGVYVVFFSCSGTKLPNYILPAYVPAALMLGHFLDRWRRRDIVMPNWVMTSCLVLLSLFGFGLALGTAVAGGAWPTRIMHQHYLPGLEWFGFLGLAPILGAIVAWAFSRRDHRTGALVTLAVSGIVLIGGLAARVPAAVDQYKAPRPLAQLLRKQHTDPDIRIGCLDYFEPSLVFYCRREVSQLATAADALRFLHTPLPAYLFVPASDFQQLAPKMPQDCHVLDRHFDLYRNCDVVLVSNR